MFRSVFRPFTVVIGIVLLVGLVATSCAPAVTPTPTPKPMPTSTPVVKEVVKVATPVPITKHFRVAWIPPDMFNPFWTYNRQGMEKIAAEALAQKGYKIDITQLAPIKTFDVGEQVAIFENAIQMKVDGIICCVIDQNSVMPATRKAKAAGIPVVALSTDIPIPETLTYSGVKNVESARITAEWVINNVLGGKGKFVLLSGIPGNLVSEERMKGYRQAIEACGSSCELLAEEPAYFNREKGMAAMETLLVRFPHIDAAFCVNDEAALGAYEAVAAAGREDEVHVVGYDGNKDAIKSIMDGKITASLDQDPWRQGADALKALIDYWEGKQVPRDLSWVGEVITPENAPEKYKRFAEMEIWYKP